MFKSSYKTIFFFKLKPNLGKSLFRRNIPSFHTYVEVIGVIFPLYKLGNNFRIHIVTSGIFVNKKSAKVAYALTYLVKEIIGAGMLCPTVAYGFVLTVGIIAKITKGKLILKLRNKFFSTKFTIQPVLHSVNQNGRNITAKFTQVLWTWQKCAVKSSQNSWLHTTESTIQKYSRTKSTLLHTLKKENMQFWTKSNLFTVAQPAMARTWMCLSKIKSLPSGGFSVLQSFLSEIL